MLQTDREEKGVLSFHELVELFFVREYTSAGVPLTHVRDTAAALANQYGPHPFAAKQLLTDGKRFAAVSEHGLITPSTCQLIADFAYDFVREAEFEDDHVRLWRPKEGENQVTVDAERSLGEPILTEYGTPTRAIFQTFVKEQDFDAVSDYYDLTPQLVKRAVEFELRFANAA